MKTQRVSISSIRLDTIPLEYYPPDRQDVVNRLLVGTMGTFTLKEWTNALQIAASTGYTLSQEEN